MAAPRSGPASLAPLHVGVRMAVAALVVGQPPQRRALAVAELGHRVAGGTAHRRVLADQGVARARAVIERGQAEAPGIVAARAVLLRLAQPKLPEVHVGVAAFALARRFAIALAVPRPAVDPRPRVA